MPHEGESARGLSYTLLFPRVRAVIHPEMTALYHTVTLQRPYHMI
jgi:hypothetical protein